MVAGNSDAEETSDGGENETVPRFGATAWTWTDHPVYFYAGLQNQMNFSVNLYNWGPGNISVNVTWNPFPGFALMAHGNATVVIPKPRNENQSYGKTILNFTINEDTITPGHAPYQNNLTITFTAVEWESDVPPDPLERSINLDLRYEELNPKFEIERIPRNKTLTESFMPPFHADHNYPSMTNLGNVDLRFECQVNVDTGSDGTCTANYLNSNRNYTETHVDWNNRSSISFDLEFVTVTLPAMFDITIKIIPTIMSNVESIRAILLESRIYHVMYYLDHFSNAYIQGWTVGDSFIRYPQSSLKHNISVWNRGNSREYFTIGVIGLDDTSNETYKVVSMPEGFWLEPGEKVFHVTELKLSSDLKYGFTALNIEYVVQGSHGSNDSWKPPNVIYREKPFNPAEQIGEEMAEEIGTAGYVIGYTMCYGIPLIVTIIVVNKWAKKKSSTNK